MTLQVIDISPVEPARIGWRQARGAAFSGDFLFRNGVNGTPYAGIDTQYPQLVLRPRSDINVSAYDLAIVDTISGRAHLDVPGTFFSDPRGYTIELYFRNSSKQPTSMVAQGAVAIGGGAYAYQGPLFSATLPSGPAGPAGPAGAPGAASTIPGPTGAPGKDGQRGSMWMSGSGTPPVIGEFVAGDMWLNTDNGDVWKFDGDSWLRA